MIARDGTSAYNDRQALDSVDIINAIKKKGVIETEIGVVAPYRAHADRVVQMLGKNSLVESDTVHKFQGREKDVIIYNSVMGKLSPFNDDAHLINVAVSRAKTKFIVVAPLEVKNTLLPSNLLFDILFVIILFLESYQNYRLCMFSINAWEPSFEEWNIVSG